MLNHLAGELTARERELCEQECATLSERLAAVSARRDVMPERIEAAVRALEAARHPPEENFLERRLAEECEKERPDSLVRARRAGEHARRIAAMEANHLKLCEDYADAVRGVTTLSDLRARRRDAGRAAALRIHEHASRRVATYLQHLVRTHPDGPRLNALLRSAGPDLPRWAREPPEPGEVGTDQTGR